MNLGVIGYLLTIMNLNAIGGNYSSLKDIVTELDNVATLKDKVVPYLGTSINDFRNNGYSRKGDIGIFMSDSLRDYIFQRNIDPTENGIVIFLSFERINDSKKITKANDETLQHILLPSEDISEDLIKLISENLRDKHARRSKRSFIEKLH